MSSRPKDVIYNHKRIIVIIVAIAAISMYLAPFDKLMGLNSADAAPGGKKCPPPGAGNGNGRKYGILKHAHCAVDAGNQAGQTALDNAKKVAPPQAQGRLDAAKQDLQARTDSAHSRIDQGATRIPNDSPTTTSSSTHTTTQNNDNTNNNNAGPSKHLRTNNNDGGSSSNNDNGGSNDSGHSKADNAKSKANDAKSKANNLRQHARDSVSKK